MHFEPVIAVQPFLQTMINYVHSYHNNCYNVNPSIICYKHLLRGKELKNSLN